MQEAIPVGHDLHESAEFFDANDLAAVDLADLDFRRDRFDLLDGPVGGFAIRREDVDRAVVFDIYLAACGFHDTLDDLALWSDDGADLLGVDVNGGDARRVLGEFGAVGLDRFFHLIEDQAARFAGLLECLLRQLQAQTVQLEIGLEAGDALAGAGDLEIHVAEMIFGAKDVGEHGGLAGLLIHDEADGDARDGRFHRHASIQQGEGGTADARHRGRAVRFHDLRGNADGVREIHLVGDHRLDGTLGESAMSYFAATGPTGAAGFANAERREVVMKDKFLFRWATRPRVHVLRVGFRTERGHDQGLRFAALENGGAMGAGQDADFAVQLTKVAGAAAIGALVVIDDGIADGVVLNLVERLLEFEGSNLRELLLESLDQLVFEHVLGRVTGEFARGENRAEDLTADEIAGSRLDFRADGVQFHLTLGLADLLREFLNGRDNLLGVRMGEFDRLHHIRLGNLLASAFDHDQVLLVADVHEVEVAVLALGVRWIDDEFASDAGDAHRGDRAMPRNIGNTQGGGRAVDREHVGIIFGIGAEQDTDDLRVVVKTFGEQRATWAVDHAGGEDFLFGGSSLAFEVAAGEFARRRCFLAVVNGEREKVEFV